MLTHLILTPVLAASLGTAPDAMQTRQYMTVDETGAYLNIEYSTGDGIFTMTPDDGVIEAVTAPRYTDADGGLLWIAEHVSVGDSGAIAIAGKGLNNESVTLYSTNDPQFVFDVSTLGSEAPQVAVAGRAPLAASLVVTDVDSSSNYDFEGVVHVWSATGTGAELWTYTFPLTLNYFGGGCAVSDDGNVVLAWKANPNTSTLLVEAFDSTGASISSGQLQTTSGTNTYFHARQARLSADGSRAYFFIGTTAVIYDVQTATVEYEHNIGASFDSHALSDDGSTFAFGNFGRFEVWTESSPGNWTQAAMKTFGGSTYVGVLDLNADGSRLGYINQRYSPNYDHLDVGMYDVTANTDIFTAAFDAPGTIYQMVGTSCRMDAAGDYLCGSSWGDSLNITPEAFAFDAAGNLTAEIDMAGSGYDSAIDLDGDVFVSGGKAVHANTFGNGGQVIVSDVYEQELHVVGYPQAGGVVSLEVADTGNQVAIAVCDDLGNSSTVYGQTELDLTTLLTQIGPISIPTGGLSMNVTIPAGFAGQDVHLQAVILGGAGNPHLTNKVSVRVQP